METRSMAARRREQELEERSQYEVANEFVTAVNPSGQNTFETSTATVVSPQTTVSQQPTGSQRIKSTYSRASSTSARKVQRMKERLKLQEEAIKMELRLNQNRQHQLTLEEEEDDAEDWSDDSITEKKMPFVNEWVDQQVKVQSQQTIHLDVNRQMEHENDNQQSSQPPVPKPRLRSMHNVEEKVKVNPTAFKQERFPQPPPLYKFDDGGKPHMKQAYNEQSGGPTIVPNVPPPANPTPPMALQPAVDPRNVAASTDEKDEKGQISVAKSKGKGGSRRKETTLSTDESACKTSTSCWSKKSCGKDGCTLPHHPLLHLKMEKEKPPETDDKEQEPVGNDMEHNGHINSKKRAVLLRVVPVLLQGPNAVMTHQMETRSMAARRREQELEERSQYEVANEFVTAVNPSGQNTFETSTATVVSPQTTVSQQPTGSQRIKSTYSRASSTSARKVQRMKERLKLQEEAIKMELRLNQNRQHQLTLEEEEDDAEDWSDDSITEKKMPFVNEWVDQQVKVQSQQTIHLDVNRQMEHENDNQQSSQPPVPKPRLRSMHNVEEKVKVNPTAFKQERFPQPPPLYKFDDGGKPHMKQAYNEQSGGPTIVPNVPPPANPTPPMALQPAVDPRNVAASTDEKDEKGQISVAKSKGKGGSRRKETTLSTDESACKTSTSCWSKKSCGKDGCTLPHHPLLHLKMEKEKPPETDDKEQEPVGNDMEHNGHINSKKRAVLLRVVPVLLQGPNALALKTESRILEIIGNNAKSYNTTRNNKTSTNPNKIVGNLV
ncbi:unnamed protein product [Orchesella dallaii]|uniref:C3H1-type domain-containing protein n=1 Tax=Orchesella dallaii TaxID=48710 RepID=A0ABP1S442_9HEXA